MQWTTRSVLYGLFSRQVLQHFASRSSGYIGRYGFEVTERRASALGWQVGRVIGVIRPLQMGGERRPGSDRRGDDK